MRTEGKQPLMHEGQALTGFPALSCPLLLPRASDCDGSPPHPCPGRAKQASQQPPSQVCELGSALGPLGPQPSSSETYCPVCIQNTLPAMVTPVTPRLERGGGLSVAGGTSCLPFLMNLSIFLSNSNEKVWGTSKSGIARKR